MICCWHATSTLINTFSFGVNFIDISISYTNYKRSFFFFEKFFIYLIALISSIPTTMWIIWRTTNTDAKKKNSFQLEIFTLWFFLFRFSSLPCFRSFLLFFHSFIFSIGAQLYSIVLIHCSKTTIRNSSRNLCIAAVYTLEIDNFSKIQK